MTPIFPHRFFEGKRQKVQVKRDYESMQASTQESQRPFK